MLMILELVKLFLGLAIMFFHRPIADFVLEQERSLVILFRERGFPLPPTPSTKTAHNIYFFIGGFVAVFQLTRIWLILHGHTF